MAVGECLVILMFSHPKQEEAWWADVKAAFPDAESRASRTIFVRKQSSRFDADPLQTQDAGVSSPDGKSGRSASRISTVVSQIRWCASMLSFSVASAWPIACCADWGGRLTGSVPSTRPLMFGIDVPRAFRAIQSLTAGCVK